MNPDQTAGLFIKEHVIYVERSPVLSNVCLFAGAVGVNVM